MRRVWCGFEVYVAHVKNIPIEVILPETAAAELDSLCRGGLQHIRAAIHIDIANAKATAPEDEEGIKRLIRENSSFDEVNHKPIQLQRLPGSGLREVLAALRTFQQCRLSSIE